jgi:hypothetical protein
LKEIELPSCASSGNTFDDFIRCAREAERTQVTKSVIWKFLFDPEIDKSLHLHVKQLAQWTLPFFQSLLSQISFTPTVTIIISASFEFCTNKALPVFVNRSAPTSSERNVYCGIGGANGGHVPGVDRAGAVLVRIPSELKQAFKSGSQTARESFELNGIMTSEIAHAMRSFLVEEAGGGCSDCNGGSQFPNWAAYLGNQVVGSIGLLNAGWSREQVRKLHLQDGTSTSTWRPSYADVRLRCGGNPGLLANQNPNSYAMQVAAAHYLVGTYGVPWLFGELYSSLARRNCDLDGAALSLFGGRWSQLEGLLDDYIMSHLAQLGISVPN